MRAQDYDVLLLVGGSIGVTPFASIMADLVNRLETCPCGACGSGDIGCKACGASGQELYADGTGLAVEKVYFRERSLHTHTPPQYIRPASRLPVAMRDVIASSAGGSAPGCSRWTHGCCEIQPGFSICVRPFFRRRLARAAVATLRPHYVLKLVRGWLADWVVRDSRAPNYLASTLETISKDDQLNLIEPRIHLTTVKANTSSDGPDLEYILTKVPPPPLCRLWPAGRWLQLRPHFSSDAC